MIIEVEKEGKYIGKYRFINEKLHKLNEPDKHEGMQDLQNKEE